MLRSTQSRVTLLVLGLCGCEPRGQGGDTAVRDPGPAPGPDTTWRALARTAVTDYSALKVSVEVPPNHTGGRPLALRLVVRNSSARPVWLETGDSTYAFDLVVSDSAGREVWSRLHSRRSDPIPMIILSRPIAPGDSASYSDSWDGRTNRGGWAPPGRYQVHGTLNTHESRSEEVDVRTEPRPLRLAPGQATAREGTSGG